MNKTNKKEPVESPETNVKETLTDFERDIKERSNPLFLPGEHPADSLRRLGEIMSFLCEIIVCKTDDLNFSDQGACGLYSMMSFYETTLYQLSHAVSEEMEVKS